MSPELVGPDGTLEIGQGVAVRLKGTKEKGEFESPGPETIHALQERGGQELVAAFLQGGTSRKYFNGHSIARS